MVTNIQLLKQITKNISYFQKLEFNRNCKRVSYYIEVKTDNNIVEFLHKNNGPAYTEWKNNSISRIEFWLNGKLHRKNGPAICEFTMNKGKLIITNEYWYIDGEMLNEERLTLLKNKIVRLSKLKGLL